jgi:hypothetical protein
MAKIEITRPADAPLIEVNEAAIGRTSIGFSVCDIEVLMDDGKYSRFFVSVRIKNGRPVVELATNTKTGSTRKTVTGFKRKSDE